MPADRNDCQGRIHGPHLVGLRLDRNRLLHLLFTLIVNTRTINIDFGWNWKTKKHPLLKKLVENNLKIFSILQYKFET